MLEKNPVSAIFNNVLGTKVLADYSVKSNVEKFIFISKLIDFLRMKRIEKHSELN